ncbi:hypothetical protein LSH36_24g07001 [Paralvinella palmiformis]|uniref:CUB domain-containing protein n=1 Tax=Paralvinella palmiformis TaxID=53620 RepID=A0AAD9KC77_9ANNE|nr:hypothetical protein LSH36_24g07001 [Paralvinella palmiformis]
MSINVCDLQKVQIGFQGFELESSCVYDFLQSFNGGDDEAPRVGYYFGSDLPGIVTFSGNTSYLKFTSDVSITYSGFLGFYKFV